MVTTQCLWEKRLFLYFNNFYILQSAQSGNTKGGSITVLLISCLTGLDLSIFQIKTKIFICHTADSKPVKQEVNGTVILPPLVFPGSVHPNKQCSNFSIDSKQGIGMNYGSFQIRPKCSSSFQSNKKSTQSDRLSNLM